jgi:hypothetical protein
VYLNGTANGGGARGGCWMAMKASDIKVPTKALMREVDKGREVVITKINIANWQFVVGNRATLRVGDRLGVAAGKAYEHRRRLVSV